MSTTPRQDLANYALRHLGAPVINVEVDASQIEDAINDAIQHYHEYHFDGLVRDFLVHKITGTTITLVDAAGFSVGDTIESTDGKTKATIAEVSSNTITINHQIGYDKFHSNQEVKSSGSGNITNIIPSPISPNTPDTSIILGDIDKGWIECGDTIVGVIRILNISSLLGSSDYMFNMQYQLMMTELQALTKAGAGMYWQTLNYLGHLDFIMKKEKNFTFNRRMNRLMLEIAWGTDIKVGDIVVAEVYRALDENTFPEIYDDIWLKRYVTALLKKQWAINTKKYTGMQLPGGMTYNSQQMFDEAMQDIEKLEAEALYSSSPLDFMCG